MTPFEVYGTLWCPFFLYYGKKRNFIQGCYYWVKPAFIYFTLLLNYGKGPSITKNIWISTWRFCYQALWEKFQGFYDNWFTFLELQCCWKLEYGRLEHSAKTVSEVVISNPRSMWRKWVVVMWPPSRQKGIAVVCWMVSSAVQCYPCSYLFNVNNNKEREQASEKYVGVSCPTIVRVQWA